MSEIKKPQLMLHFDERGHLLPYQIVELTLPEFEAFFVENLNDQKHRRELFERYLVFVGDLKRTFQVPLFQWVDGSFITRKELPGDMDVVTFLPYDTMAKKAVEVHHFIKSAKQTYFVDAVFCPVCKWNHRFYQDSKEKEAYWFNLYTRSRLDVFGKRHPKGLVKIDFAL